MKKYGLLILLIFSILIVPCGCKNNDKEKIKKPEKANDTTTIKKEDKEEKVENNTKQDKDDKKQEKNDKKQEKNDKKENKNDKKQETKKEDSKKETIKKEENNSNNATNKTNDNKKSDTTTSNNSSSTNVETETKKEETDEISILRNNIQNTYDVTIKYGDEIGNYNPKGLTPTKMTDKNEIKTYLNYTKNELAKYPNGFFKEMKNFGMPLTIYLVNSVPNNSFSGFTDREFTNNIKITVVKSYDFSYTLNHEIMHYIDTYLECKMYPDNPYTEYISLNPPGYNYGNPVDRYNFGYNGENKEVYFMDNYAQTNVREDRAQVFRQMISRSYKLSGMFDQGTVLQSKALVIDKQIRQYYNCAKGTLTWDKFIK